MLSIALSMVVVNCIVMLVQGYDFDSYRKVLLASDFQLDQMTGSLLNTNFNGITPEIKEILDECLIVLRQDMCIILRKPTRWSRNF